MQAAQQRAKQYNILVVPTLLYRLLDSFHVFSTIVFVQIRRLNIGW